MRASGIEKARKDLGNKLLGLHPKSSIYFPYIQYPLKKSDGSPDTACSVFSLVVHESPFGQVFVGIQDADSVYLKGFWKPNAAYRFKNDIFEEFSKANSYEDFAKILRTVLTAGFLRVML